MIEPPPYLVVVQVTGALNNFFWTLCWTFFWTLCNNDDKKVLYYHFNPSSSRCEMPHLHSIHDSFYDQSFKDDYDLLMDMIIEDDEEEYYKQKTWDLHIEEILHQNSFKEDYRMSYGAWNKLRSILKDYLQRKEQYCRDAESIYIEIIMGIGIRYLTGGMIRDSKRIYNVSRSEAYRCVEQFINAINLAPELAIKMPETTEEWETIRKGFANASSNGIMQGCLGAIDGYFQPTICPRKSKVKNIKSYYSGHYESYGLNCQAVCDVRLRFLFFGVVAPGSTNDAAAFPLCCDLVKMIKKIPKGCYLVGECSIHL
jgi:hypothetical protein